MYRVLCIDGGGMKGVFPAAFLAALEREIGRPIGDYFDLAVGTSTGGIIVLGLGSGMRATELLDFYEARGPIIFRPVHRRPRQMFNPKYDVGVLAKQARDMYGATRLGDSRLRLAIPTYNVNTGATYVYRTPHSARHDAHTDMVTVALATAAAPVFFEPFVTDEGTIYVDGGLYAANPIGLAVVEAIGTLGWPSPDVQVLSIGTTETEVTTQLEDISGGIASFYKNPGVYIDMLMRAQVSFSEQIAATMLPGPDQIHRINVTVPPGRFALDSADDIDDLKALGTQAAARHMGTLLPIYFRKPARPFAARQRLR